VAETGLWAGLFFIVYTIFGFFILPVILQKASTDKLTQKLGRQVSISKIKFNPYSLSLSMEGININERNSDKPFFSIKQVLINLQASSIFRLAPVIREVNIDGLFLNTIRNKDQSYNFSDLIPSNSTDQDSLEKKEDTEPSKPFRFSISNIVLSKSSIILNDLVTNKTHALTEIELAIPFVSNLNTHVDIFVTPHFSVKFNGSPINITDQAGKKIEILVKALSERPGLNLEIAGYVNVTKDRLALKKVKFDRQLKAGKLKKIVSQGKPAIELDEIELSDEEYDVYLKAAFKQTKTGAKIKRKDLEKITQDQMIQTIQQGILIGDDELKNLASARALTVKGAILADKTIESKRIFIVEAPTLEPERDDKSNDNGSVIMTLN
jgi:hypothetical protein